MANYKCKFMHDPQGENSIGGMNKNSIHQNALQNRDFVGKVGFYILEAIQVM